MVTDHVRLPRRSRPGRTSEDGSALIAAVAITAVVAMIAGTLVARATGSSVAAVALNDRVEARALAEQTLMRELVLLDAGGARARLAPPVVPVTVTSVTLPDGHLEVDGRRTATTTLVVDGWTREIEVRVEAQVGSVTHIADAVVRPRLSSDQAWLSEHRSIDPTLTERARLDCTWAPGDPRRHPACIDVPLGPGAIEGPVHSNEPLLLVGGTQLGSLVTSAAPSDAADDGLLAATAGSPFAPRVRDELVLPREVGMLAIQSAVTCRFRGPTLLRFDGERIRVRSPRSVPRESEPADAPDIGCMGIDRTLFSDHVVIDLPARAVIEVVRDDGAECAVHPLGLADDEDTERDWWCGAADAFVWGRYRGARTVLAHDHIQVIWDLEPGDADAVALAPAAGDVLGLVAGDSVVIRRIVGRPVRRVAPYGRNLPVFGPFEAPFGAYPADAPTSGPTTWESPMIVAAMAALRGSVAVQNPFRGEAHAGPIRVVGSIATRFSGIFGWEERTSAGVLLGSMGYPLEMHYDLRLDRSPPPAMPMTDGGRVRILELRLD
jgi:hypothetical protein